MITIDNSISNNQPELSSSISYSCHFGDLWSRGAPGAGFGMSGGSQTLPWHSEGGMDRMDSWQTKKSCVFLGQKSMRQWISAKKQLYCMSCMSLSVVMTYVRDGPTQCVTPLLEFLTKKIPKGHGKTSVGSILRVPFRELCRKLASQLYNYIAYKETHGIYFSCSVSTQKHPRTLYVIRIYSYIIRILDVCTH